MPDDRSEKKATRVVSLVYFELSTVRAGAGSAFPLSLRRFADFSTATRAAARRLLYRERGEEHPEGEPHRGYPLSRLPSTYSL